MLQSSIIEIICSAPAVHLLSLEVASIFEQLNVVEEEADHPLGLLQIGLHLRRVLRWLPCAHHPHVLRKRKRKLQRCMRPRLILHRIFGGSVSFTVCSRVSTWLSCSSHTPDSIWTLLTTRWSRSSLQRDRGEEGRSEVIEAELVVKWQKCTNTHSAVWRKRNL